MFHKKVMFYSLRKPIIRTIEIHTIKATAQMVKGNIILPLNKPGYQFHSTKVSSIVIHSTQT